MTWYYEAISDPGSGRHVNEDALLVDGRILQGRGIARGRLPEGALVAIADGVGGGREPHLASRLLLRQLQDLPPVRFADARRCRQTLAELDQAFRRMKPPDMASTLVGVRIGGNDTTFFGVGDSRAYVLRGGQLRRATTDHNVAAEMVVAGELAAGDVQRAGGLLRALTAQFLSGADPSEAFIAHVEVAATADAHRILLCSDGLSASLDDTVLAEHLLTPDPDLRDLVRLARARDATDDVSVIVLTRSA